MKVSPKWSKMAPIYRLMASDVGGLDFSEQAAEDAYLYESTGAKSDLSRNGYAVGKMWLNVTLAMWREDIRTGLLFKHELYEDPVFADHHEWLDGVLA